MMFTRKIALAALLLTATAGTAFASDATRAACAANPAGSDAKSSATLSEPEIRARLVAAGFTTIRSIGREDGCVEAKGLDSSGKRFEVYLHPATGAIVGKR